MSSIILNEQQEAVLDWAVQGTGSLNLVARAGCGKTSTLLELVLELVEQHPKDKIFLGAFNKAIATELQERLKQMKVEWKQAEAGTLHSLGFRLWRRAAGNDVKVNDRKVQDLIALHAQQEEVSLAQRRVYTHNSSTIRAAVSLAKQSGFGFLCGLEDRGRWYNMAEHYGLNEIAEDYTLDEIVDASIVVLRESIGRDYEEVDYDDMLLAPLLHNAKVNWPYDWVMVDEAQDTNACRRALALKVMKPKTGRLVAVGDDRQAIYGFTGSDSDAMDLIKKELGSAVLPLNITYRCPKRIVEEAQKYVPDITAHETAPEGAVEYWEFADFLKVVKTEVKPTDVVLCRNTKPLIDLAYALIRAKVGCRVEGRDIGKGLMELAHRWKIKTLETLRSRLDAYKEREIAKWQAKGQEVRAGMIEDKVDSLVALIEVCSREGGSTIADLTDLIKQLFNDTPFGEKPEVLTLSTIHKSKGREWPRVFILGANAYMPSRYARKEWQKRQEDNLAYVAITRAKQTLVYITV